MRTDYKPGDLALVEDPAWGPRRMVRRTTKAVGDCWHALDDDRCLDATQAGDIRPLVVLDPDDREQVEQLVEGYRRVPGWNSSTRRIAVDAMQTAIEAQTRPPKPAEPTGRWSVVEDASGDNWVRDRKDKPGYLGVVWLSLRTQAHRSYDQIDAVRVLSEGVVA